MNVLVLPKSGRPDSRAQRGVTKAFVDRRGLVLDADGADRPFGLYGGPVVGSRAGLTRELAQTLLAVR